MNTSHARCKLLLVRLAIISLLLGLTPVQNPACGQLARTRTLQDTASIMQHIRAAEQLIYTQADSALPRLHTALRQSIARHYRDGIGMSLFDLALAYSEINRNDTALYLYDKAVPLLRHSGNYAHMIPAAFSNIAYIYYFRGEYPRATGYLDSAIRLLTDQPAAGAKKHLVITLNTMAAVYMRMERPQTSLHYLLRVEQLCRENGFTNELAMVLGNQGELYTQSGSYDKAEQSYRAALQTFDNNHSIEATALQATLTSGYATLQLKQGRPAEAVKLLQAIETRPKNYRGENTEVIPAYTMGLAYLRLHDYPNAGKYLRRALARADALQVQDNLEDIHQALAQTYEATREPGKALAHFKEYQRLRDSLLNNERLKAIGEMELKYRAAEQQRELATKQLLLGRQEAKLHRLERALVLGFLAALAIVLFLWNRAKVNKQKQLAQAAQVHLLQNEQQLNAQQQHVTRLRDIMLGEERERSRIARELHDGIVSQLTGIKLHLQAALRKAGKQLPNSTDFETTLHHLEDATQDLRKTAHQFIPDAALKQGLVAALAAYCTQMTEASGVHIIFQHFTKETTCDRDMELALYRMAQELVQNAIKHANCDRIVVELTADEESVHLEIEDNGNGMPSGTGDPGNPGIGLQNIKERIRAWEGQMHIDSQPGEGTSISIELQQRGNG